MRMYGDLYQPLGLHLVDRPRRRGLPWGTLAGCLVAAGLLAGSAAIALQGHPQRRVADDLAAAAPPATAPSAASVKVIRGPIAPAKANAPAANSPGVRTFTPNGVSFHVEDPASARQSPSVAHLPDPDLVEDSAFGPLPKRAADGRRPFDVYAGVWSGEPGPRIAIVVGGIGISQTSSMEAVRDLPSGVTLGFAAAGNSLDRWMQEARRAGHELLLQVPLEPTGYPQVDPGANTVTVDDAKAGDFDALYASLGRMTNYVGIMNYMGGRFTGESDAMQTLITELGRRGLMYLDDGSSQRSVARDTAALERVPAAASDVVIDRSRDAADIRRQLDTLERIARSEGQAIGVASAFDVSIATIDDWITAAKGRGVRIVPVSALADDPEGR